MKAGRLEMARRERVSQRAAAREISIPIPLRGLLSDADASAVNPQYAAELKNWRSTGTRVEMRNPVTTGGGANDGLIQAFPFEFGSREEFIEIYNDRYVIGGQSVPRGVGGRAYVAYISGSALIAGAGLFPVRYNGSTLQVAAFLLDGSTFNTARLDGVIAHHDRAYFWDSDEFDGVLRFYYGDVGAVQGELQEFPLGRLGNITGSIATMVSMTVDAGHGINDMLVVLTTTGDAVFYEGLDPSDPQDWRLAARLRISPPRGRASTVKVGGDVWVITQAGIVSLADSLRRGRMALVNEVARPVVDRMEPYLAGREASNNWQMHVSVDGQMVIANLRDGSDYRQWIYYLDSQTWAEADYRARWFFNLGGQTMMVMEDGAIEAITSEPGEPITAVWHSAWIDLGRPGAVTYLRPHIQAEGALTVTLWVMTDRDEIGLDVAEAVQTVTLVPERPGSEQVMLDDIVPVDASGSAFQVRMEVTAPWARLISMRAGVV